MEFEFNDYTQYYVVSDLHGQGKLYDSIIKYVIEDSKRLGKKPVLIIAGDVIDRGPESMRILCDIMNRSNDPKSPLQVVLLPGNHEEMMYQAVKFFRQNHVWDGNLSSPSGIWFHQSNHGTDTAEQYIKLKPSMRRKVFDFLKSLPLFVRIKSSDQRDYSFVIVHALPIRNAMTLPANKIPTLSQIVEDPKLSHLIWCLIYRRNEDNYDQKISVDGHNVVTIIGHTPVENSMGHTLEEGKQLLSIDGGCAYMAQNRASDYMPEMASLIVLSNKTGKSRLVQFGYGSKEQESLRQTAGKVR